VFIRPASEQVYGQRPASTSARRHGQEPGADIARYLLLHGAKVDVQLLSSGGQEVGRVLLSQAAAFGADLLVMGAYSHSKLHEWMIRLCHDVQFLGQLLALHGFSRSFTSTSPGTAD
jgi:nucleotide-binding universal stress UspA family protein